jgi:hypothetical protein
VGRKASPSLASSAADSALAALVTTTLGNSLFSFYKNINFAF